MAAVAGRSVPKRYGQFTPSLAIHSLFPFTSASTTTTYPYPPRNPLRMFRSFCSCNYPLFFTKSTSLQPLWSMHFSVKNFCARGRNLFRASSSCQLTFQRLQLVSGVFPAILKIIMCYFRECFGIVWYTKTNLQ